jgi:hypothetical protein
MAGLYMCQGGPLPGVGMNSKNGLSKLKNSEPGSGSVHGGKFSSTSDLSPVGRCGTMPHLAPGMPLIEYFVGSTAVTRDLGAVRDITVVPRTTQSQSEVLEDERRELSAALFCLLLGPVVSRLLGISHLCIVPHGPLALLPFAVLGEDRLLIEQVAISYAKRQQSTVDS